MAHRYVWEQVNNKEIPEGHEVDHVCRNRACINPTHLQVLDRTTHLVKTNQERYYPRKHKAKNYWLKHRCSGMSLSEIYGVSFSSAGRWIREWKGVETRSA